MIRDLAARRGLTLRQVAQRAGIAEGTLYNAVKQSNARPLSIGSIGRIANAFGVTIEELVGEESAPDVVSETITDDSPESTPRGCGSCSMRRAESGSAGDRQRAGSSI